MNPKDIMIQAMRSWMLGDYGHDLPTHHFEQEVDRLLGALDEAGLVIVPREPTEAMSDQIIFADIPSIPEGVDLWKAMVAAAVISPEGNTP